MVKPLRVDGSKPRSKPTGFHRMNSADAKARELSTGKCLTGSDLPKNVAAERKRRIARSRMSPERLARGFVVPGNDDFFYIKVRQGTDVDLSPLDDKPYKSASQAKAVLKQWLFEQHHSED